MVVGGRGVAGPGGGGERRVKAGKRCGGSIVSV